MRKDKLIRLSEITKELLNAHDMTEEQRALTYGTETLLLLARAARGILDEYIEEEEGS